MQLRASIWKQSVRFGLLAGAITAYTGLIGMIKTFSERALVGGVITLGQLLIFAPAIIAGYLLATHHEERSAVGRLTVGAIAGFCAALPVIVLALFGTALDVRSMFVNLSPDLIDLLTLGMGLVTGSAVLLAGLTVLGLIGAAGDFLAPKLRHALVTALIWTLTIGLLSELVRQVLTPLIGSQAVRPLFVQDALRPLPALVLFIAVGAIDYLRSVTGRMLAFRYQGAGVSGRRWINSTLLGLLVVILLGLPWLLGSYLSEVLANVGLYVLMGLGLNLAVGLAGLLDLGYVTNFAVGAYIMGVLTSNGPLGVGHVPFLLVLPISMLCAMLTGFTLALPVLRMRGDYLAIATLGFGEIIRILALSDWLAPVIGGVQGILFIPPPQIATLIFDGPQKIYYIMLAGSLLMLYISVRLNNSRAGRQWMAIREDEDAAGAMGIDTMRAKLLAFTLSAASGGLAGAIFASKLGTIFPQSFQLFISINALAVIIVGGMGSIPGIIIGAFALIGLPEFLREFAEYRLLLYGALLIVMMLARPEGLWPSAVRRRELEEQAPPAIPYEAEIAPITAGDYDHI